MSRRAWWVGVAVLLSCGRGFTPVAEPTCSDGVQNGAETGVDCGGPACAACGTAGASCSDGVRNGAETGVDCGGAACEACAAGSCSDGVLNQDETGVDCGGPCGPCAATCSDRRNNQDESDIDCGGASCPRCAVGQRCVLAGDCASGLCAQGVCVSCTDGVKSGDESAIDCGGPACPRCADGATCRANGDCSSGNCGSAFVCLAVSGTCFDAVRNGAESDVDCGGPTCPRCVAGARCGAGTDCLDAVCTQGVCAARASCADGVRNGDESAPDCGGSFCARCQAGVSCTKATDCLSGLCTAGACVAMPSCTDGLRNGDEAAVDCGGSFCARCGTGSTCSLPEDCSTGFCSGGVCVRAPTCNDGVRNGDESDVDCGGPLCTRCMVSTRCNVGSDCASGRCNDQLLWTDTTWRYTRSSPASNWSSTAFDDSAWQTAVSQGLHGSGPPWGASPPMPPQTQAHWIWWFDSRFGSDNSTLHFRKTFVVPASPFVVHVAADDRSTVWLNGQQITSSSIWFTPGVTTVSNLTAGTTAVLGVRVENGGGPGGLVADLRVTQPRCAP